MKFTTKAFLLFFLVGTALFADPVEGFWLSYKEKTRDVSALWHIYTENGVLYGKMVAAPAQSADKIASQLKSSYKNYPDKGDVSKKKTFGEVFWIFGLKQDKNGAWSGGTIIDPESKDGASYSCRITFHGADGNKYKKDTIEVFGGVGIIGRTVYWERTTENTL